MLLSPQAGCGNGMMSPPCLCVPAVLLGHHCTWRSVCKNTMAGLRDSMVGGWRRRQGNEAGEQIPFPLPAPFCEQRLLFLTKIQPDHSRLQWLLKVVPCPVLWGKAQAKKGWGEGWKTQREMGQGRKGKLLGPTGLSAVKGKPRCCKTFLLCTALHHQK